MKKLIVCIFIALLVIGGYSFREIELDNDDYVAYVEKNLSVAKQIEDLQFKLLYCPTEYLMVKESKNKGLDAKTIEKTKEQNDSMMFFRLRVSHKGNKDVLMHGINSDQEYYERAQFLSYGLEENIALIFDKDTIFPAIFHFERTYGVVPFADFIFAFKAAVPETKDEFQILVDDKAFGNGLLKFTYDNNEVQNIPHLKKR